MFVVVTTFYTLDGVKSILLPQFVFFSFKATPFSQKYKFIILLVYLFFMGCCTTYYNIPGTAKWWKEPAKLIKSVFSLFSHSPSATFGASSLPEGAFGLCVLPIHFSGQRFVSALSIILLSIIHLTVLNVNGRNDNIMLMRERAFC